VAHPSATANRHFHAVRFYEDDASLCRIVADFVGDGLVAGQPGIVIVTPPHRDEIARRLEALSFDVGRLRDTRQLLLLDAEQTLEAFMKEGFPDPAAFRKSVGGVLDRAAADLPAKPTVRAYGEMIDVLWKQNAAAAAIRLEMLWNQLADTHAFSLLCGYSMGNFYKHGAYEDICGCHTHVVSSVGHPTRVGVA